MSKRLALRRARARGGFVFGARDRSDSEHLLMAIARSVGKLEHDLWIAEALCERAARPVQHKGH